MVDIDKLKIAIKDSGLKEEVICERSGIKRRNLYNRLRGVGTISVDEMVGLSKALKLSKSQINDIFCCADKGD